MATRDSELPPFPDGLPMHDLRVVDFGLLVRGDGEEEEKLWKAATEFGFWYTKNHGLDDYVEGMFEMGCETLALPMDEKMKYWQGNQGDSFGYKAAGGTYADIEGNTDIAEFINVSKDNAFAFPNVVHRAYPEPVNTHMVSAVRPFIRQCVAISSVMMRVFERKLGLGEGGLTAKHDVTERSICETRCIRVPPQPGRKAAALGPHTDFGSISFLVNKLGGLQALMPGTRDDWRYVKPIPRHAICNVGDTLSLLSGGILKSCYHRVAPPPGEQVNFERWSLVYFVRPSDDVQIDALVDQSEMIREAVEAAAASKSGAVTTYKPGLTAKQWFKQRQMIFRTDSQQGKASYLAGGGRASN